MELLWISKNRGLGSEMILKWTCFRKMKTLSGVQGQRLTLIRKPYPHHTFEEPNMRPMQQGKGTLCPAGVGEGGWRVKLPSSCEEERQEDGGGSILHTLPASRRTRCRRRRRRFCGIHLRCWHT